MGNVLRSLDCGDGRAAKVAQVKDSMASLEGLTHAEENLAFRGSLLDCGVIGYHTMSSVAWRRHNIRNIGGVHPEPRCLARHKMRLHSEAQIHGA
jgi:hypothetical protein